MFILTCVVKHAFGCLEVVPCGSHVGATSAPSWTGSATCPRFSSGPLLMWQMMGSRQNQLWPRWHLTWPQQNLRGWCVGDDVACHVNKLFGGLGFKSVFALMSTTTHGCFRKHYPTCSGVCLRCLYWHLVCGMGCNRRLPTCQYWKHILWRCLCAHRDHHKLWPPCAFMLPKFAFSETLKMPWRINARHWWCCQATWDCICVDMLFV